MPTQRRGHGEGSVSQRADGTWIAQVDLGRGLDGRRQRKTAYGATQADAVEQLRRLGGRAVEGELVSTSTPSVASFLTEWFITFNDEWRPSTQRCYESAIRRLLIPAFRTVRLEQLTPLLVQRWLTQHKQAHGARRRVELAHAVLRSALSHAQRLQLVTHNAAKLVIVPTRAHPRTIVPLTLEQARALLVQAETHRLEALFSVALACGLRLGEATGLSWSDVDLTTGDLHIRQQLQLVPVAPGSRRRQLQLVPLKTAKSRRTLKLPRVCLEGLKTHRTRQLAERLKAGPAWQESGLVFTTYARRGGRGLHPRNVLRTLHTLLTAADLPVVRFHDLRHSAASLLIAKGVQLAEVSLLLGHSELRVTADLYSHLQQQTAAKAARQMDALLRPGR